MGTNTIDLYFRLLWLPGREWASRVEVGKLLVAGGPVREDQAEIKVVTQMSERNDGLMDTEYILNVYDLKFIANWIYFIIEGVQK